MPRNLNVQSQIRILGPQFAAGITESQAPIWFWVLILLDLLNPGLNAPKKIKMLSLGGSSLFQNLPQPAGLGSQPPKFCFRVTPECLGRQHLPQMELFHLSWALPAKIQAPEGVGDKTPQEWTPGEGINPESGQIRFFRAAWSRNQTKLTSQVKAQSSGVPGQKLLGRDGLCCNSGGN